MPGAPRDRRQMHDGVGRAADRLQHHRGIAQRRVGEDFARPRAAGSRHCDRALAGRLGEADPLGRHRRRGRGARQHEAERLGQARHGEAVPITMQVPADGMSWSCARSRSVSLRAPAR